MKSHTPDDLREQIRVESMMVREDDLYDPGKYSLPITEETAERLTRLIEEIDEYSGPHPAHHYMTALDEREDVVFDVIVTNVEEGRWSKDKNIVRTENPDDEKFCGF